MRQKFWNWIASILDRIPSGLGIPLLVAFAALIWIGAFKLFGL